MIRLLPVILVITILTGCFKDEVANSVIMQEASFGITLVEPNDLKNDPWDFLCTLDENGNLIAPANALIDILDENGNISTFNPQVFFLNGQLYTQAIKLKTGSYEITRFLLMANDGTTIVMATPFETGSFAKYVNKPLSIDFEIEAFTKSQVDVEVLCFSPENVGKFGFSWFEVSEIVIRQFCFFGDICANGGTSYQGQTAYGGNFEGTGSPWWFYFDVNGPATQTIYAGQQPTDGTVTYHNGQIIIDLGSAMVLKEGDETVKIKGFNVLPASPVPLGPYPYKGTQLVWDVAPHPYYVIHLDVNVIVPAGASAPFGTNDFVGSDYENLPGGLQMDMPAIFKIHVFRTYNGQTIEMPHSPFSNLGNESSPLCVKYPDRIRIEGEEFSFELHILVPDGNGDFIYQHYHTFTSTDGGPLSIDPGSDKILEFVLGNCNYSGTDLQLNW